MQIVTINKNDAGQRLDKFIAKAFPNMPKSMMYKFIRTKKIKRNRKRAEISDILEDGDTLQLFVSEEFLVTGEKKIFSRACARALMWHMRMRIYSSVISPSGFFATATRQASRIRLSSR